MLSKYRISCLSVIALLSLSLFAQDFDWEARANMPAPRWGSATFVLNGSAYVVGGKSGGIEHTQMWAYDPVANSWTGKSSIPVARRQAFAFSSNGKGYVGCGINNNSNFLGDMWEYDPASDTWTARSPFPAGPRYNTWQFVIDGIAYVGGGNSGGAGGPFHADAYSYDPLTDTWGPAVPIPDLGRHGAIGFSLNGKGYVVCGRETGLSFVQDVWMFDPAIQTWSALAPFPGASRSSPMVFTYNNTFVIGCGRDGSTNYYDAWLYYPNTNSWTQISDYPGATAMAGTSFSIGNRAFGGLGWDLTTDLSHSDLWELVKPEGLLVYEIAGTTNPLLIFPDPAERSGSITFRSLTRERTAVWIYAVNGSFIAEFSFTGDHVLPVADLASGLYQALWKIGEYSGSSSFTIMEH